ncbi:hypothetical protein J6590_046135 [Homalodisca vitripennis]|nr:hypothetical protein J6590_046135 [Homalodisca vitripennis]
MGGTGRQSVCLSGDQRVWLPCCSQPNIPVYLVRAHPTVAMSGYTVNHYLISSGSQATLLSQSDTPLCEKRALDAPGREEALNANADLLYENAASISLFYLSFVLVEGVSYASMSQVYVGNVPSVSPHITGRCPGSTCSETVIFVRQLAY